MINLEKSAVDAVNMLKDFQKATVERVFENLYGSLGAQRQLVADEVGLGKTIVAKGLIAKIILDRYCKGKASWPLKVVYICSNQAIARQNLHKLNLSPQERLTYTETGRLIFLALQSKSDDLFQITALTPSTSFHMKRGTGIKNERKLIWMLLTYYQHYNRKGRAEGLKYVLLGDVQKIDEWLVDIERYNKQYKSKLNDDIRIEFRKEIRNKTISFEDGYLELKRDLGYRTKQKSLQTILQDISGRIGPSNHKNFSKSSKTLIQILRNLLTDICTNYLEADLFVLDEFQRFKELIQVGNDENLSDASRLARKVFNKTKAKVLMLSATPYKAYSTSIEQLLTESDPHYREFQAVLEFLSESISSFDLKEINYHNDIIRKELRHPDGIVNGIPAEVKRSKNIIEDKYRTVISRTERVLFSLDKNVLLKEKVNKSNFLTKGDIKHYTSVDKIQQKLEDYSDSRVGHIMNYVKSAPYMFSFMEGYKHKKKLSEWTDIDPSNAKKLFTENLDAWIPTDQIDSYKLTPENIPNVKMRTLIKEVMDGGMYRWLWLPPNLPYYSPTGVFKDTNSPSKILLFSKWRLVPRAVSAMVSYESERRVQLDLPASSGKTTYFQKNGGSQRQPSPILQLSNDDGEATTMRSFSLLYPSYTLSLLSWETELSESVPFNQLELIKNLKHQIQELLREAQLEQYVNSSAEDKIDTDWYWVSPLLLDKTFNADRYHRWLTKNGINNSTIAKEASGNGKLNESSLGTHINKLIEVFENPESLMLGKLPDKDTLSEVLAMMAVASPANVALRMLRIYDKSLLEESANQSNFALNQAFSIAYEFRSLFDKPESINLVRAYSSSNLSNGELLKVYWFQVLRYCLDGNLQAVMDEYAHMLKGESDSIEHFCDRLKATINIRTSVVNVDSANSVLLKQHEKMRCHLAVPFGIQEIDTSAGQKRAINVVENFNSPFRPFVLASTSIGQEGLDLHYYCRKIMHWNLPYNPVDLEQREGRINRYKGLVIRQNISQKASDMLPKLDKYWKQDLWEQLFDMATNWVSEGQPDLYPFWLFENGEDEGNINIERMVPIYPFSNDENTYKNLISSLAYYRLTLGQPRQEELVNAFKQLSEESHITKDHIQNIVKEMLINLAPISYD